ncbi:PAS domain S-box protein [Ktedonosporobacter rubrisoli]|uniref:histidine kinase n=1 Tax=Ktedonosporobacter rubrisoli TaxID=2509675 RepID=A0A4V0Z0C5_KTERU|nr:ATP-binding protein [Ktedonosporobacter rubrisoli]QBD82741.1 PAS domain S-box protein [Ktedonosporobacter rubrisoli]
MIDVEQQFEQINAPDVVTALLHEFSAVTDYRTLRDSLPRRLADLLKCRCVLFYQRLGETLQLAGGSFDDSPGWSASLLSVAHINPISLDSDLPEACAWRERLLVAVPVDAPALIATPLIYRHRGIGILVALRQKNEGKNTCPVCWGREEVRVVDAVAHVVALLLENTRLLEKDRERIHELSLLNSISSQMNCSMYETQRLKHIVIQRAKEISAVDLCAFLEPHTEAEPIPWITSTLHELLFQRFQERRTLLPLVLERPGDLKHPQACEYLHQLPENIKTFFAVPLLSGHATSKRGGSLLRGGLGAAQDNVREPKVLGIIVGAYHRAWKLRREEVVLLQVLASQASAVLENMLLVAEVVEARNEARKLLRQVLKDQRLKELILESIPSGLITTDSNDCIATFNRAAEAILGYHPCEVLGQPLHKFLDLRNAFGAGSSLPAIGTAVVQASRPRRHYADELHGGTVITVDRQGRNVVLDVDVLPLCDDLGEQMGTLATFIDVTSVHRLEEEKRRLDRLASLGEMAANVAHEVRNPLASIKTSMQILMDDLASDEQSSPPGYSVQQATWAQESIAVVLKEVERLDKIVRDLLLFARPRQLHRVKCDLIEVSDRVLLLIQAQCAEANVAVHRVYERVPCVWVDMDQIEQILLNLYMNAVQAMPDGGILTVACHVLAEEQESSPAEGEANWATGATADNRYTTRALQHRRRHEPPRQAWLEIAVSDTGVGIPPEQLERIFQPFFTTKAHGIGLGLAITRRLVEDHGGYMQVEGHLGYGATISVRLPVITEAPGDVCP